MQHAAHVAAVDAHAEGHRGHHHVQLFLGERLLRLAAIGGLHARVVMRRPQAALAEEAGHGLGVLAAEAVDDRGLARVPPQDFQRLP